MMKLKNYTTSVSAGKTIMQLEQMLSECFKNGTEDYDNPSYHNHIRISINTDRELAKAYFFLGRVHEFWGRNREAVQEYCDAYNLMSRDSSQYLDSFNQLAVKMNVSATCE